MKQQRSIFGVATFATVSIGLAAIGAAPASAVSSTSALWEMNEGRGATTMIDSSGNGNHGEIGSAVRTSAWYKGAEGYKWAFTSPTKPPVQRERLILVRNNDLNPGSGDYAVEMRYRTNQPFGNIIQKGQGGAAGGYFKIENPKGKIKCVFRGRAPNGDWRRKQVQSPTALNDNQWHTMRCEREGNKLRLYIDGALVKTANGSTGTIWNNQPISIGGKKNCNQVKTTCDYFTGHIDYIKIEQ
jgi:hypothetical protein